MMTNSSLNIFPSSPPICYFNTSLYPVVFSCFSSTKHSVHFYLYTLINLLLILPPYLFILWLGFQRWRYNRSGSGQTSHTDVFTYCMASMETLTVFGQIFHCCAIYTCSTTIITLGYYCICIGSAAQTFFHCLTCMERYLAVVHPIIYMKLKRSHGVKIRNICIFLAWLMSLGTGGFIAIFFPIFPITAYFSIFAFIIMIVCFCSLAVFCVLMCSGMRRDQMKWRAFHTIVAITGTLMLRFYGQVSNMILFSSERVKELDFCENVSNVFWLYLPSSLVLPLLFLHRNGKLTCQKRSLN